MLVISSATKYTEKDERAAVALLDAGRPLSDDALHLERP